VQSIALWREQLAQQKDKTRRRILSDDIIIQLALSPPDNINTLNHFIDNKCRLNDEERQQLLKLIGSALQSSADTWPDNRFSLLDNQQKLLLKHLQQIINKKAEELNISSTMLSSKKELETLILFYTTKDESPDRLQPDNVSVIHGWRFRCIGEQLIETIKNSH
jgi:ribonuclease D